MSEPTLGLIRLQWWRDEITNIYAGKPHAASEVLSALSDVITVHGLTQEMLFDMVAPYDDELRAPEPPKTVEAVLDILSAMHTPVLKVAAFITGAPDDAENCRIVAQNRGLIDVLQRAQPQSIIAKNGEVFKNAFQKNVQIKGRIIKAFQAYSILTYSRIVKGAVPAHHPNTPLRLWTSLLFQW